MAFKSAYLTEVYENVCRRDPDQPEFQQAVKEVLESLELVLERRPDLVDAGIIERIVEPERMIMFRVAWVDDQGKVQVNRGYRVQFNSAIGPYKGGLRLPPLRQRCPSSSSSASSRCFKNCADHPAHGRRQGRLRLRPQGQERQRGHALLPELHDRAAAPHRPGHRRARRRHRRRRAGRSAIMYGQYKRIRNEFTGVLTGKGLTYGGSLARTEATGYGLCYFTAGNAQVHARTTPSRARRLSSPAPATWPSTPARRPPSWAARSSPCPTPTAISTTRTASTSMSSSRSRRSSAAALRNIAERVPGADLHRGLQGHLDHPVRHRPALRDPERAGCGIGQGADRERLSWPSPRAPTCPPPPSAIEALPDARACSSRPPRLPTPAAWPLPAWR